MKTALVQHHVMRIQAGTAWLDACLSTSGTATALILHLVPSLAKLQHSRENEAAQILREAGFNTLLLSLLTPYEAQHDPDLHFDVALQARRVSAVRAWINQQPGLDVQPLGLLASDTAAAAAIRELAQTPAGAFAIVCRAGRADLAGAEPLRKLACPILLQVPEGEPDLLRSSQQAFQLLPEGKLWQSLPGARAELEQACALEHAMREARDWFTRHQPAAPTA